MARFLSLLICFPLSASLLTAQAIFPNEKLSEKSIQAVNAQLAETEGNIAKTVAQILSFKHYSGIPFNDEISEKFLNQYIQALDGQHLFFLESDLKEFEVYKTTLDDLTMKKSDTTPAHIIFKRFLERVNQRVSYVTNLLQTEKFTFTGNDRYTPNRKELKAPKDMAEAKQLWKQQLRYELLQEKLAEIDTASKAKATNDFKPTKLKDDPYTQQQKDHKLLQDASKSKRPLVVQLTSEEQSTNASSPKTTGKTEIVKKESAKKKTDDTITTLTKRYLRQQKSLKELSDDEVLEIYLTCLAHAYDPHSDYFGKAQLENFDISMRLSLFGIGAVLQSEDGYCKIAELKPGPAQRSKQLKPNDRIVAVAQGDKEPVDVVDMKLNKVVELIRGEKGTEVRLTVIPAAGSESSERKVVTLIRDEIKLEDQQAKAKVFDVPGSKGTSRIGVIDLPSFYEEFDSKKAEHKSTSVDVAKLLKKLNEEKVSGLILDLRHNGGGSLREAVNLTGLFIKRGPVVQIKDANGDITALSDNDPEMLFDKPLIILISRFSASASEILAGALQDYGRAIIVGDSSTFGKATVQQLLELRRIMNDNNLTYAYEPGALKPTNAKFYRPSGSSTQFRGVRPDIELPSVNNYAEIGEAFLDNPLQWDDVSTAKYERMNLVQPYVADLKKRSLQRIQTEKDFSYIREDIERYKKILADKSVSLNEEKRLKESKEIKASDEARKKERLGRKPTDQKVFEVTLNNADKPGLQPYIPKTNEVATAEAPVVDGEADPEEEKAPDIDPTLNEARQILSDFILQSAKAPERLTQTKPSDPN